MSSLAVIWRSSVGKQAIAASSGLILFGWLVLHVAGNLLVFAGPEAIDGYAAALRRVPVLLWAARGVLGVAFAIHVAAVVGLMRQAQAARTDRSRSRLRGKTLASRSMRAGGLALLGFLVLHLLDLTFGVLHPAFDPARVYENLVAGLRRPEVAAAYVVASLLVGLHLFHGLWSSARSVGARTHVSSRRRPIAFSVALVVALGFAAVPLAIVLGVVR